MADVNEQRAKMIANLPDATGKALAEWVNLIAASGLDKHGAIVKLLKGMAATDRLEASGSFNAMVSHRVRLESDAQVDAQLRTWLERAYNAAG